jgi:hypothetical protein
VRKFTAIIVFISLVLPTKIIIFPNIINQCVRKSVREFGLSNENPGNC